MFASKPMLLTQKNFVLLDSLEEAVFFTEAKA